MVGSRRQDTWLVDVGLPLGLLLAWVTIEPRFWPAFLLPELPWLILGLYYAALYTAEQTPMRWWFPHDGQAAPQPIPGLGVRVCVVYLLVFAVASGLAAYRPIVEPAADRPESLEEHDARSAEDAEIMDLELQLLRLRAGARDSEDQEPAGGREARLEKTDQQVAADALDAARRRRDQRRAAARQAHAEQRRADIRNEQAGWFRVWLVAGGTLLVGERIWHLTRDRSG